MWPFVAFALLYPLSVPAADWLTRQAGRERPPESRTQALLSLAFYLAVSALLAAYGFLATPS